MPTENELRLHRCCFTGHRPEKLNEPDDVVIVALESAIRQAVADGFVTDIWAAEIVLRLKREGHPLHLICASPFDGFDQSWGADWRRRYAAVMADADFVKFICPHYSRACFQIRNEWMVDRSARVIAVYNGESGGTRNTINYAARRNVGVVNVLDNI